MKARFSWTRLIAGTSLLAAGAIYVGGIAGCDVRQAERGGSTTTEASSVDLSTLPEEFVATISSPKPTVVDFYATWCPPCQDQKPLFADAKRQYGDVASFVVVDVDEEPSIPAAYEVSAIPTLIIYKEGQVVDRMVGVHSPEEIYQAVQPHLE